MAEFCDECGTTDLCEPCRNRRRRVRMDLDGGHMEICLDPDASAETIAALKALGQAAVEHMREQVARPTDGRTT